MRWAWRLATVAGIPIKVHGTFAILIVFILGSGLASGNGVAASLASVLFILAIFVTIILHELGHALTARRFGIKTRDITVLPIGGLARLERMPDIPRQELWVALAGPAVNLVIGAVCYALMVASVGTGPTLTLDPSGPGFLERFTSVNFALAIFNMIPAFPMDGGRALRAVLAERIDYTRATQVAASVGQGLALVFGLVGLFLSPVLVFIALFVWMGASGEATAVSMREALAGAPVSLAMITDFQTVRGTSRLSEAVELVLAGTQRDFPVIDETGRTIIGILSYDQLMSGLNAFGNFGTVDQAMTTRFETADAREMLDGAYERLQGSSAPVLPILHDGNLVGVLTAENVAEYVMLRGALASRGRFLA